MPKKSANPVIEDHKRVVEKAETRLKEAKAALAQAQKDEAKSSTKRKG
jgi:hypothetical protein